MQLTFKNQECLLVKRKYESNKRLALILLDAEYADRVAICSINLDDHVIEDDEIAIKSYSENEGMLNVLIENNIVKSPHRFIQEGFVVFPICKMNFDIINNLHEY